MYTSEAASLLTIREQDVLRLVMQGKTNKEIAHELHLSIRTVEHHITQILAKLGLKNRVEVALWGRDYFQV
jgi:DNA-binding NarL/FixJ family response regulator